MRSGHPSTARNHESRGKIQQLLLQDQILSIQIMLEMNGINRRAIRKFFFEDVGKKKVCAHFVLRCLMDDQKKC